MATKGYNLEQTGEQVQAALNKAINLGPATEEADGLMTATDKASLEHLNSVIDTKVDKVTGKGLSTNDFTNEEKDKLDTAYQVPSTGIPAADMSSGVQTSLNKANSAVQPADLVPITEKIPAQASAQNQLADKAFVNSSISTASADFKGTYDSLAELQAETADKNDYGYVVSTDEAGNTVYSRYKYNGSAWVFEYDLNNSSFTAAEWASIQSQITAALVQKLSALPTNQELGQSLSGKQDIITDLSTIRSGAAAGATAYQKPDTGIPAADMASGVQTSLGKADTAYQKPASGIPKADLVSGVQDSLDLADSALQYTPSGEIDPEITPADYATQEELTELEAKVDKMPTIGNFNGDSDLDIIDEYGYVIGRFASGDFKTKNFDSTGVNTKLATIEEGAEVNNIPIIDTADGDLVIADGNGNILAKFKDGGFKVKNFDSSKSEKKVKILCIGNSWTCDSFEYVGALLNEILADESVDIHIGVCYEGGASLQTHYNNLSSNNTYTFYEWTNSGDSWAKSTKAINTILALDSWDIVILQQVSSNAGNYATYQPYLNDCLDLISERVSQTVKFGWNLVRERVTAPLTDFADISTTAQGLLQKTLIQFIIPSGTATQNARTTSLDSLGTGGHLTYDGSHLQDGLPCLVEAYATTLSILSLFGFGGKGLNGSQFRPTQTWIDAHGMNGQANGSSVGVTESNVVLAKKCATIAVNNPYVVTDCSNL